MEKDEKALEQQIAEVIPTSIEDLCGTRGEGGCVCTVAGMHREWSVVAPKGVRFSDALMLAPKVMTVESMIKMGESIVSEAKKLNIAGRLDLIALCCTSGSFVGG